MPVRATQRQHLLDRRAAVYATVDAATGDDAGRALARAYLDAFFTAIADEPYYRPIVVRTDVQVFLDAEGTR